ncbi:MAG: rhomboid family intramembrane serine protease [Bacilli bacterium]
MEEFDKKDVITMKLLHYFITNQNYNPVVLHGAKNEIWLENMNSEYKIVRIVSGYIHNNEQLDFDTFKTRKIVKNIKRKTLNLTMPVLSIFVDLGDNVNLKEEKDIDFVSIKNEKDVKKYDFLYKCFPDIDKKLKFTEKGMNLFLKITDDINKKNMEEAQRVEELFKPKKPIITYGLIAINVIIFLLGMIFNLSDDFINLFANYGPLVTEGQYYRLFTSMFIHANLFHILFNMYALYLLGAQAEGFFGKGKFLVIYILSGISGSLLSILLNQGAVSVGASGAIFGILGALLYFGYNNRVYLGNTLIREIVPVIIINLAFGFMMTGVDNFAHIGGLIGGITTAMAVGFYSNTGKSDRINGIIITIMLFAFLIFMNFFYAG